MTYFFVALAAFLAGAFRATVARLAGTAFFAGAAALLAGVTFLAGAFLAGVVFFTGVARFAGAVFLTGIFLTGAAFLAGTFFAGVFTALDTVVFFAAVFFATGLIRLSFFGTSNRVGYAFKKSLSDDPAVNLMAFAAGIWTASPVRGFRPVRSLRSLLENEPKLGQATLSPPRTADFTVSKNASRTPSTSFFPTPAENDTRSIMSALFTNFLLTQYA